MTRLDKDRRTGETISKREKENDAIADVFEKKSEDRPPQNLTKLVMDIPIAKILREHRNQAVEIARLTKNAAQTHSVSRGGDGLHGGETELKNTNVLRSRVRDVLVSPAARLH